jgi:pimeloyl-ACP methyl ester carboxylesterase
MYLLKRIAVGVVVVGVLAYLGVLGGLYFLQRDFQYDRSGRMFAFSETTLTNAELVSIPSAGGSALAGWYQAPQVGKPVIMYFRGNAQSFSREHERYEAFVDDGYGFLAFDYRGFPGSPGEVTEENVLADAEAAYAWLEAKGLPIVLWGRSLGSAPATYIASRNDAAALVLETPFLSAVAVAAARYGFLPVGLLMHDQYPVNEWIVGVDEPVWVGHGTADTTIGYTHGERVYDLARNKDELWIVEGAGHGDLWDHGIWDEARAFIERVGVTGAE